MISCFGFIISFLVDQVPDMDDEYESYMLAKAYFDLKVSHSN